MTLGRITTDLVRRVSVCGKTSLARTSLKDDRERLTLLLGALRDAKVQDHGVGCVIRDSVLSEHVVGLKNGVVGDSVRRRREEITSRFKGALVGPTVAEVWDGLFFVCTSSHYPVELGRVSFSCLR